ncbi:MAG: D-alanyl-D-alanine carboxypeptidase family protein, partial [Coprococcus sp.]
IMTCYLALKNSSFDETLTMSYDAIWGIERDSSNIALDVNENITMKEGLYALMLESANEVAWAIGEHISGGSITDFTGLMTKTAADLGCKGTNFTNANGLHDEKHYTTCYDMALITKAALSLKDFRTITSTLNFTVAPTNLCEEERPLNQHCKMVQPDSSYYYEYCEGGKTGYTEDANNTLVTWAKKGDTELICVIMDCMGSWNAYTDSKALYEYCFNNYTRLSAEEYISFSESDRNEAVNRLNTFYSTDFSGEINLSTDANYYLSVKNDWNTQNITTDITYTDTVTFDELSGTYNIGNMVFKYNGNVIGQTPILVSGYSHNTMQDKSDNKQAEETQGIVKTSDKNKKHSLKVIITIAVIIAALTTIYLLYAAHVRKQRKLKSLARKRDYERRLARIMKNIDNDL